MKSLDGVHSALITSLLLAIVMAAPAAPLLNQPTGQPYAPEFTTPKARYWLAVSGKDARVRNLKVWDAHPNPARQRSDAK